MSIEAIERIVKRFIEHDDGEFTRCEPGQLGSIREPTAGTRQVVYATKPSSCLRLLDQSNNGEAVAAAGCYGVPPNDGVAWLRAFAKDRTVFFLGDADPVDLLTFAWLRFQMPIIYLGINDSLVQSAGMTLENRFTIPLSDSEVLAMPLLAEVCPDYSELLGPQCSTLLESGRKLEVEAMVSFGNKSGLTHLLPK